MKKIVCLIFCFFIFLAHQTAFAAPNGGIAGHYYYTDIKTYFFGAPITAYNLNGKTAIISEDLNWHYNHDVYWYPDERKLTVDKKDDGSFTSLQAQAGSTLKSQIGKTGDIAGNVYYSNIKTYLNGRYIESYNIGGQTVIICEDMREYGYDVEWDADKRTLSISGNNSNFIMESDIGMVTQIFNVNGVSGGDALFTHQLTVDGYPVGIEPAYSIRGVFTTWVPLAPTLTALGAEYEWNAGLNKLTVISFESAKIKMAEPMQSEFVNYLVEPCPTINMRLYYKDREIPMTMTALVGHTGNMREETFTLNPVVYNGVVYAPLTAITDCLDLVLTADGEENIVIPTKFR